MAETIELDLRRTRVTKLVKQLSVDTQSIRKAQRKAKNYEYEDHPERRPQMKTVRMSGMDGLDEPSGTLDETVNKGKPLRGPAVEEEEEEEDMYTRLARTTRADDDGMDDYDPRAAAAKLMEDRQGSVMMLRQETSALEEEIMKMRKEYDKVTGELEQLHFEDDVARQRADGAAAVAEKKSEHQQLKDEYNKTCLYYFTLEHMYRRLRDDKTQHTATLKTFESALRTQRQEDKLQGRLLTQVTKAKVEEAKELAELQDRSKQERKSLEEKMEGRRQEVQARAKLAKEKVQAAKKEAELKSRALGDLTAAEERQLRKRTAELQKEMQLINYKKMLMAQKVEKLYQAYNDMRIAAGVKQAPLAEEEQDDGTALPPPQPHMIVSAFLDMQSELMSVDDQLMDLNDRMAHLMDAESRLLKELQPKARTTWDEKPFDRTEREELVRRRNQTKRKLETAKEEFDKLRGVKVQFDQAVDSLHHRLSLIPSPYLGQVPLEDMPPHATMWAMDTITKVREAEMKLQYLQRATREVVRVSKHPGDEAIGVEEEKDDGDDLGSIGSQDLDAEVDIMVSRAAAGVRIEPPNKTAQHDQIPNAIIHNAAHQYSHTHSKMTKPDRAAAAAAAVAAAEEREANRLSRRRGSLDSAASQPSDGDGPRSMSRGRSRRSSRGGFELDPFSKEAAAQRRRNSRIDIQAALAAAAAAAGEDEEDEDTKDKRKKRGKNRGPKPSDLTKFIASAVHSGGGDVEEFMLAHKDYDEVHGRNRMKKDSHKIATDKVRRRRLIEQAKLEAKAKALQPSKELLS